MIDCSVLHHSGTVIELEMFHEYNDNNHRQGSNTRQGTNIITGDDNTSGTDHHTAERTHELNVDIEAAVTLQEMQVGWL